MGANKSTLLWSGESAEERAGTPTPRCFEIKSAQAVEKKRVEFFVSAKKRKRVWKNVKRQRDRWKGIRVWEMCPWSTLRVPNREELVYTPAVLVRVASKGLAGYRTWKKVRKMGDQRYGN